MYKLVRIATMLGLVVLLISASVYAQDSVTLSTTDQQYQNLVANGDFENWSAGKPTGWSDISGAVPAYTQTGTGLADTVKRLSSYSVKVATDGAAIAVSQGTYQRITVEPNTTYTFSCYFYSAAGEQAELKINGSITANLVDRTGANALASTGGQWKRFAASFTTGADTYVDIKLYAKAVSNVVKSAYFDGIILTQGPLTAAFSQQAITEKGGQTIYGGLTLTGDAIVQGGEVKLTGLSSAPAGPSTGTVYFNTTDSKLYVYNGTSWVDLTVQGITYSAGNDLDISGTTFNIEPQLDFVSTIASPTGTLNITGNIVSTGTITQSRTIYLIPNYENALIRPDGGTNRGTLKTSYATGRSFYEWTTNEPTTQDCDIVVRVKLPDGFSSFDSTSPIVLYNKASDATGTTAVDVAMYDTNNAEIQLKASDGTTNLPSLKNTSWGSGTTIKIGNLKSGGTPAYTVGGWVTLTFKLTADQNDTVDLGELSLKGNW